MTAQVSVEVTGSAVGSSYRVSWTVTTSVDMPTEIFVYMASTNKFSHVAAPSDLTFPTTRDVLISQYRRSTAEELYSSIAIAEAAKTNVATAIAELVAAYNAQLNTFLTTVSTTYE